MTRIKELAGIKEIGSPVGKFLCYVRSFAYTSILGMTDLRHCVFEYPWGLQVSLPRQNAVFKHTIATLVHDTYPTVPLLNLVDTDRDTFPRLGP